MELCSIQDFPEMPTIAYQAMMGLPMELLRPPTRPRMFAKIPGGNVMFSPSTTHFPPPVDFLSFLHTQYQSDPKNS